MSDLYTVADFVSDALDVSKTETSTVLNQSPLVAQMPITDTADGSERTPLMAPGPQELVRCEWAKGTDDQYVAYHDDEWGVPVHDDTVWFEFIVLEGAQAGLSWSTVLKKRENYRRLLDGFDVAMTTQRGYAKTIAKPPRIGIGKLFQIWLKMN